MRLLAALVLSVALGGCSDAQTPVEVADGRQMEDAADVSAWAARPEMRAAAAAARAHWRGQDASYEEDVRVMGVADGAFTEAGSAQQAVLFLMSPWPRGNPKVGLAVVEGGRLVRNVAFEGLAQTLAAVPDLDGDGRDELVLTGEFGMGGEVSRSLTLAAFGDDGLVERGGTFLFGSDCAGRGTSGSTAARVVAVPGPAFRVERYTQASCESEAWETDGPEEPLALDPPAGTAYTDLPVR
jgi:hypothetical protein